MPRVLGHCGQSGSGECRSAGQFSEGVHVFRFNDTARTGYHRSFRQSFRQLAALMFLPIVATLFQVHHAEARGDESDGTHD